MKEFEKMDIEEPLAGETIEESCFKKNSKKIILLCCFIIVVAAVVVLLILLLKKDNSSNDNRDDSKDDKSGNKTESKYDFGLSIEELEKRNNETFLGTKSLLKANSAEYANLQEGDKKALIHLVKAGAILEKIEMRIDDHHNLPFKEFLEEEIKKDNKSAKLTKVLFDAQKGINAIDRLSNEIHLAKNHTTKPGIGVYPEDLTKEEFHKILIKMLKDNKIEEVRNITNQRSIVERDGEYLKSTDYVDYFKEDFSKIADELEAASKVSTNKDFNEYLELQAKAFRTADPKLDAYADIKWAELQDTPLELTVTRENYDDELTGSFIENKELTELLNEKNITPVPKDCLGFRVGMVNKEGTDFILKIKEYLPTLAKNMPYSDKYSQDISPDNIKQTMVDADIILLAGKVGAYRAGIVLAENLPNDDKLSLKMGGGRRNVYHRQVRAINKTESQEKIDAILDPEQHKYYDFEANHWFTIGHENTHSLGPNMAVNNLGIYKSIIEENKADMGGLAFVDLLTNLTYYNEEQRLKILVTAVTDTFLKTKPLLSEAHRVRTVMQNYYLYQKGAYNITEEGKIHVNIDNVVSAAYDMLSEIILVQLNNTFEVGEEYINKYFVWTDEMEIIGKKLKELDTILNCKLENELADKLLAEN
jgi:hypothetical protein